MRKLTKKWQLLVYAFGAMGINMLNLMMGTYLCSAIISSGFSEADVGNHTFLGIDLVVIGLWSIFGVISKIVDGVIDVPMASLADNLRTRFGRRRPALLMGFIPMIVAYLLFLVVPVASEYSVVNTIYYFVVLCMFYISYTLTMVTYYATFTEIVESADDRNFMSNAKSFFDIVYFILGYVVVAALLKGMNVRIVALLVLPVTLTVLIPLLMIKEDDNRNVEKQVYKSVGLIKSLGYTFKNRTFVIWMIVYSFMTFGVQLFLSGINEYFSDTHMSMILVMASSFAPVPLAFIIYNRLFRKRGFAFAYRYTLIMFTLGMCVMFGISFIAPGTFRTIMSVVSGLICSFAIGAMFSVAYSIPSQLASDESEKTGVSNSAMYFAVQGLFSGVATGIGSYVVLNLLKEATGKIGADDYSVNPMYFMTLICALGTLISFALSFTLPKSLKNLGKEKTDNK